MSAPAATPARTIRPYSATASSKASVPLGSSSSPSGPTSSVTSAPYGATACLQLAMPAVMTSSSVYLLSASLWGEAPKVLALTTRLPAAAYFAWMLRMSSGFSMFKSSGRVPSFIPAACSMVPIPPSSRMVLGWLNSSLACTGLPSLSIFAPGTEHTMPAAR